MEILARISLNLKAVLISPSYRAIFAIPTYSISPINKKIIIWMFEPKIQDHRIYREKLGMLE